MLDAAISKKVKVAFEVPVADGPKISYLVALVANAPQPEASRKFLGYLTGNEAGAVFTRHGFIFCPLVESDQFTRRQKTSEN